MKIKNLKFRLDINIKPKKKRRRLKNNYDFFYNGGRKPGSKNKTYNWSGKYAKSIPSSTISKPKIRKQKTKGYSTTSLPSTRKPLSSTTKAKIVSTVYKKSIGDLLAMMNNSSNMSRSEKNAVNMSVKRVFNMIDYLIKNEKTSEAYLHCIKDKLKEIKAFLSDLDSVDFKIGLYIREFGFHNDFYPEEMMEIGSPKLIDALMSFEDFVNQCNGLKGR